MSEHELLLKIARAAIEHVRALRSYKFAYNQHCLKYGRFYRKNEEAMKDYEATVIPANLHAKEIKRQLDGYLFMFESKDWGKP